MQASDVRPERRPRCPDGGTRDYYDPPASLRSAKRKLRDQLDGGKNRNYDSVVSPMKT